MRPGKIVSIYRDASQGEVTCKLLLFLEASQGMLPGSVYTKSRPFTRLNSLGLSYPSTKHGQLWLRTYARFRITGHLRCRSRKTIDWRIKWLFKSTARCSIKASAFSSSRTWIDWPRKSFFPRSPLESAMTLFTKVKKGRGSWRHWRTSSRITQGAWSNWVRFSSTWYLCPDVSRCLLVTKTNPCAGSRLCPI